MTKASSTITVVWLWLFFIFCSSLSLLGSYYLPATYNALGGNANTDNLADAIEVLSEPIALSRTERYRAVVQCGAGSATWIGNSDTKSYFVLVAHVTNAATNVITTYDGTVIQPVSGSIFHTEFNDFGLLEYNAVLDPNLFGGAPPILMDLNIVDNFLGEQTTLIGYGNLTLGDRELGRTRALSTAFITLENNGRTRSDTSNTFDPTSPFAGSASPGDSGGGVFVTMEEQQILLGGVSSGNNVLFNYSHVFAQKELINSVVPTGVFTWYSDFMAFSNYPDQVVEVGTEINLLLEGGVVLESPAGASFDAATGRFLWTPGPESAGMSFPITITTAGNSNPTSDELFSFTIEVLEPGIDFWEWSTAPTNWTGVTALNSGEGPYRLAGTFPYLQGNESNLIAAQFQPIPSFAFL